MRAWVLCFTLLGTLFAADETSQAWFQKFNDIASKGKYSADISMSSQMDIQGMKGTMSSTGKLLHKDDSHLAIEIEMNVVMGENKLKSHTKMVADGTNYWTLTDNMGQKVLLKASIANMSKLDPQTLNQLKSFDVTNIANDLKNSYELGMPKLAAGKVSIEGKFKAKENEPSDIFHSLVVVMDEKSIFPVSFQLKGDNGAFMTVEMSNFKTLDHFDDHDFALTPDPSAQIIDLDSYVQPEEPLPGNQK